jgi:hypothetical protein
MAAWLPLLKASLPYISQIVTAAIPAFTSKTSTDKPAEVIPTQIAELQSAVTQNAETVKALATQLKGTIEGIDTGAARLEQEIKSLKRLAWIAVTLALLAAAVAIFALSNKMGA